jgi:hypothetical protein
VITAGVYQSKFTDFTSPLLSFSANIENVTNAYKISLSDVILENIDIPDTNYFVQI